MEQFKNQFDTLIEVEALQDILHEDKLVIVDCRFELKNTNAGRWAYEQAHLPNAIYAHLDEDLSGEIIAGVTGRHPLPTVDVFVQTLSCWGIGNASQVVVYDDKGGAIAARLWWMLQWVGHQQVAVLNGGIQAWQAAGFECHKDTVQPQPSTFIPHVQHDLLVDATFVEKATESNTFCLLDARAAERYRGEVEPIDPIAGHIPTARSAPFIENLDADKRFLPKEILKRRFERIFQEKPTQEGIVYCGSGVTACHDLLAIKYAGLDMPRLYAGSWSDWITDKNRTVIF